KEPDQRGDIFSMGVVLYEALAGQHPFRAGPAGATAGRILQQGPSPIPGAVPGGLRPVIARMLEKDPERRYQTCDDVLTDIRAVHSGGKPAGARTGLPLQRMAWLAAAVALFVLLALKSGVKAPWSSSQAAVSGRQMAVLPFRPSAEDAGSRAFANGLTETL